MRKMSKTRSRRLERPARAQSGQMTVELAVMTPVVIVVVLILVNLLMFVEACAAFDQAAMGAVIAHGVAASGSSTQETAVAEVQEALEESFGRESYCDVEVRAESVTEGDEDTTLTISPLLTRYVCTLTFYPWPNLLRLPGITLESPLSLVHERELVVDRYRSGVVV